MIKIATCSICNKSKKENLMILGKNICTACEEELVKAKVEDLCYPVYMDGIKQILAAAEKEI